MARSHIAHDCYLEEDVVISTNVCLGGWTRVMRGANLGIGSITHQFTTVGAFAIVAANAPLVKDLPPLAKYIPGKPLSINTYAFNKWNLDSLCEPVLYEEWLNQRGEGRECYE